MLTTPNVNRFSLTFAAMAMVATPIAAQAQANPAAAPAQASEVSANAMPSMAGAAADQQAAPGDALVETLVVITPNGVIDASPADLDAVQGGGYWVVDLVKGAITYCKKNKIQCLNGAKLAFDSYKAAKDYARKKGWLP